MHRIVTMAIAAGMLLLAGTVWASEKQDERLKEAQEVFQAIMDTPEQSTDLVAVGQECLDGVTDGCQRDYGRTGNQKSGYEPVIL